MTLEVIFPAGWFEIKLKGHKKYREVKLINRKQTKLGEVLIFEEITASKIIHHITELAMIEKARVEDWDTVKKEQYYRYII